MRMCTRSAARCAAGFLIAITCSLAHGAQSEAPDGWAVNIYGASYHFERERARRIDADNEFNPGLGIRKGLWKSGRQRVYAEAGLYYDSGERWAKTADITYQYELFDRFRAGVGLFFFHTRTYNDGDAFVAPLPVISYDFGPAELNVAYAPRVRNVNDINTLGFFLTWKFR
jgi:hypothetical protein